MRPLIHHGNSTVTGTLAAVERPRFLYLGLACIIIEPRMAT
jgi:hypothetical protein